MMYLFPSFQQNLFSLLITGIVLTPIFAQPLKVPIPNDTSEIRTSNYATYFTFSYPLGVGFNGAFFLSNDLVFLAGGGVAIPIPYVSNPGFVLNVGTAIPLSGESNIDRMGLSFWGSYKFGLKNSRDFPTGAVLFGSFPSTQRTFKWGIGLQAFSDSYSLFKGFIPGIAILPAFELSFRLHYEKQK